MLLSNYLKCCTHLMCYFACSPDNSKPLKSPFWTKLSPTWNELNYKNPNNRYACAEVLDDRETATLLCFDQLTDNTQ